MRYSLAEPIQFQLAVSNMIRTPCTLHELVSSCEVIQVHCKLEQFSYDFEKTREQYRNNKRTEVERFDCFIEGIQNARGFWGG